MEVLRDMHLPQGFEFHPTDIELVSHYLKRKILGQKIEYDLIPEVDIYKHKPWDLPAKCNLPIKDNKWHFFASRDRKYPTGSRKNRETLAGYWKSTGKDRAIKMNKRTIGMKKTLVFHVGRPPSGTRTEWIMHEYYIDENECELSPDMKDAFVLCRVTKRNDWALDNDNEVGNRNPHLEQLDDAATSVVSTVKPEDSAASVICPEESNHATTPVGSAELSNELQIYCKMEILRDMHLPPGFVFNPSDPELISHYLKRKILGQKIEYDLIPEVDIYKHEPWDLPEKCNLPIKNNKWHFFAYRDRKYPTGSRSNRATIAGYWKPTGKDQAIKLNKRTLGTKKTLVFHEGRPPSGRRTEWIMHEYSIDENECKVSPDMKDAFVLCRVAKRNDWALDNDNELGNRNPHLEQLDDAATSVVSTVKPEDSAASVICPEESNHATTPVGSAELSNDVGQAAITPYLTFPNGGNELDTWLEELLNPSPSFNLVADTGSADVSLTEQYAESSVTTLGSVSKLLSEVESMAVSVAPSWPQLITSGPMETSTKAGDDSGSVSLYHRNTPEDSEPGGHCMSTPSSTKRLREDAGMQESPTEISRSFKRAHAVCIGDLDANLPSGSKVTMNPSGGTMETPVSSSLGAMGPLLRKVDLLLTPKYPLRRSVKHAIQLLKEDLEEINDTLVEQSMVDSPNNKGKYWMHEVRELSYDVEDAIDALMLPHIAGNGKVRVRPVHGHRVGRLKIKGLPNMVKPLTRIARVTELRTLLWEASKRHQRYELDVCISNPSFLVSRHSSRIPVPREVAGNLVGIDAPKNELTAWLTARVEQLKVLCIVGPAGVGKTALAKELYRELGSQFECRAFVRVSRTPHMSRLLLGILSQIQRPKQNSDTCSVPNITDEIRKHLQDKRYLIVIDGLWEARVWDIIKSAFPKGHNCSRIMITCEVKDVATKFCSYHCIDIIELKPLGSQDSEKLFFDTMLAFNVQCHDQFKEVSCRILRECAGLPLATIAIAGLLASQPDNSDLRHHLLQYFSSDPANLTLDELLKGTVNLCYNILPQDLKTCLLYLTMYPEGCTIRKVDLLKQWIAEGFITPTTQGKEEVAENYFAELVNRGMIQPEKIMHNDEVLSCTVHHIVFDLIMHKSREENFTTAVDYSQTVTEFFMKVYRLSLHFSCAQYATKLEGIRLSQIRSLSFFGLLRCMPSVTQLRLLRVLILEFWDDNDGCISLNLSRISGLVLLRYLKISSHLLVELPSKIQELKFLETLEIDARVWSVPDDIVHIPGLIHLSIQDEAKLPEGIGRVTSLQTLQYFDLGNNSEDNVRSLCELTNLRDLHITCSTALSDAHLKRKFVVLAASLPKLTNLRSLTMAPGAVSTTMFVDYSSAMLSTPMFLQRLELLPPICIFSRLPVWVGKLQKLRILKIVVRVLLSSDIDVLTGLPGLTVLSLYIRQPNTQRVVFSSGALPILKYFKYTCGALFLAFQEEALPNLERLKLRFNVHKDEMYYHMNSGIENLLNLKEITVKIGAADGATESDKKAAESAIKSAIRKHPRFPIYMNVRRIGWVEEE